MTLARQVIGYLILLGAPAILWFGTKGSWLGWWLMDREDMIAAQRHLSRRIAKELERRGS